MPARQDRPQRPLFVLDEVEPADPASPAMPLAARMRPRTLAELVGQDHLVGEGRVLRRALALIGATTENPSFEVNSALLSRTRVFTVRALTDADVELLVRRALADSERGLGGRGLRLEDAALRHLVDRANGDARVALNGLELAADAAVAAGLTELGLDLVEEALQQRALSYDQAGDQHYDTISAFIKSIRGSDPDAAVYWLAR